MLVGIIGGGPSGLAAAISAARKGDQVLILEKQNQIGKKLLASGNGRCNLMNLTARAYYGDPDFASKVMGSSPIKELELFWSSLGLFLRYDSEGRGYPCTFMSATVLNVLKAELKRLKVKIHTGVDVTGIKRINSGFQIKQKTGDSFFVNRVVISTGGAAQPKLGGNLSAWPWLEEMGHPMIPATPSLTPMKTDSRSVSGLSGQRIKCDLILEKRNIILHREKGEILFTDHGVSGICVMQCSRFLPEEGGAQLRVNLIPGLFNSRDRIVTELIRRKNIFSEEDPTALLRGICTEKIGYAVCKQAGFSMHGEKNNSISLMQIENLVDTLTGYKLTIIEPEDFERAQVMAGGADCKFFSPENLQSVLIPGLQVTGELLNVDGDCGGYNLMFAFLSGLRAGENRGAQI